MGRAVRYGKPSSVRSSRVAEARMSRARGPHSAVADATGRDVVKQHAAVVGQVPPEPAEVVLPDRRAGDQQEAVRGDPGDRQVALDAAAAVEQLGVDDPADRRRRRRSRTPARGRRRRPARRPRSWRTTSRRTGQPRAASRAPRHRSPATSAARPSRAAGGGSSPRAPRSSRTSSAAPSRTSRRRRPRAPARTS